MEGFTLICTDLTAVAELAVIQFTFFSFLTCFDVAGISSISFTSIVITRDDKVTQTCNPSL